MSACNEGSGLDILINHVRIATSHVSCYSQFSLFEYSFFDISVKSKAFKISTIFNMSSSRDYPILELVTLLCIKGGEQRFVYVANIRKKENKYTNQSEFIGVVAIIED